MSDWQKRRDELNPFDGSIVNDNVASASFTTGFKAGRTDALAELAFLKETLEWYAGIFGFNDYGVSVNTKAREALLLLDAILDSPKEAKD